MKGSYVGKPAGGKLLRLDLEWDGERVIRASIRGDFFAHPEDAFDEAEAALAGVPVAELGPAMARELASRGVTLFGLSPDDVGAAALSVLASGAVDSRPKGDEGVRT
jgi:hypothetical protein